MEEKQSLSWTNALRSVVRNCYRYHGREELLDAFSHTGEPQPQQVGVVETCRTVCPGWANLEKNLQVLKSKNNPVSANGSPEGGPIGGIRGFARMREDGPEIARRADRVGVLPHAPLVGNLPECALRGVN